MLAACAAVGLAATGWSAACARRDQEKVTTRAPITDFIPIDRARAIAIRSEPTRSIVERVDLAHGVRWRAAIPPYAGSQGRPGLASSAAVVHVRVVSDAGAELVILDLTSGRSLASLRLSPSAQAPTHAMSVTAPDRSYQLVADAVVAVPFERAEILWRRQVAGRIDLAAAAGDDLVLVVDGRVQLLVGATGDPRPTAGGQVEVASGGGGVYSLTSDLASLLVPGSSPRAPPIELTFDPSAGSLTALEPATGRRLGAVPWPAGAPPPEPHHYREGALWIALPRGLAALDARTLRITAAQ